MVQSTRPISPHLQIYKPQLTSVLSILHRISGVFSFIGAICILIWLVSLAWDKALYVFLQNIVTSLPVQLVLFLWSFSLIYHLLNGVRHLMWDAGKGMELPEVYKSGKLVIGLSVFITGIMWLSKLL